MGKFKFFLGLWAGKLSIPLLKITKHNGTDYPGVLATKFCPDFLKYVQKPKKIVVITGTNGKTTVNNMLIDILEANGMKVFANRAGSNIASGISTVFIKGSSILGKLKKCDIAVLEVDERSAFKIYPYIKPDIMAITSLSRDSILRNAHPQYIADILTKAMPEETTLVLNADDLISNRIAIDNKRVYYGIDKLPTDDKPYDGLLNDMQICPKCNGKLKYEFNRYNHIGKASCTDCDFASPEAKIAVTGIDYDNKSFTVREDGKIYTYPLIADSFFNVYNLITLITVLRQLGFEHEKIMESMNKTHIPDSRHAIDKVNDVTLVTQMAKGKNATAASRIYDYITSIEGPKEILNMTYCAEDADHWSENICWIYDTDFELLKKEDVRKIILAGPRNADFKLRLLMAGIPEDKIVTEDDQMKAVSLLSFKKNDTICLLYAVDSVDMATKVRGEILRQASQARTEADASGEGLKSDNAMENSNDVMNAHEEKEAK